MVWKTKRKKKKDNITSFLDRTFPYWAEEDNDDDENSISSVSSIQTDDLLDDVEL